MNQREIDEATFVRAFGAQPRGGRDLEKWKKLRTTVAIYLAELPEPEPGRDRIAVVVDRDGGFVGWDVDEDDICEEDMWKSLEGEAERVIDTSGPFARAIVRCTLPRPGEPIEVDGTVEEAGG